MSQIDGTPGNDTINATNGDDQINGVDGNDAIHTLDGNDTVYGGNGDDEINGHLLNAQTGTYDYDFVGGDKIIYGGAGNDFIMGGWSNNKLYGEDGDDRIYGSEGSSIIYGGAGNDLIYVGNGDDFVYGGDGNDIIYAANGTDHLYGEAGDDVIHAGSGLAHLYGGEGDDFLDGNIGTQIYHGGPGIDLMQGSLGDDVYYLDDPYDAVLEYENQGNDKAIISADFAAPGKNVEVIEYINGAKPLPYWIHALLFNGGGGKYFDKLLGPSNTFYYTFPTSAVDYGNSEPLAGHATFSSQQQNRVEAILSQVASFADLKFVKSNNPYALNTLNFSFTSHGIGSAMAGHPSTGYYGSDVLVSSQYVDTAFQDGTYMDLTLTHEIGHALGLNHPFDGSYEHARQTGAFHLLGDEDSTDWSLMSYTARSADDYRFEEFDIAVLQYLYGVNPAARSANDIYAFNDTSSNFIWDGAGKDTISAQASSQSVTLYLKPGYWSHVGETPASKITAPGQLTINFGSVIENLIGSSFSDRLFGNGESNRITGGAGDDQITGDAGIDFALYSGTRSQYALAAAGDDWQVTSAGAGDGKDLLKTVERVLFSDRNVALDLNGNAGTVAKTLGALFGEQAVHNPRYVGIGLELLDEGMTLAKFIDYAVNARFGQGHDTKQLVATLLTNLTHQIPTDDVVNVYASRVESGQSSESDLVLLAMGHNLNLQNIDLIGLSTTGLEYTT